MILLARLKFHKKHILNYLRSVCKPDTYSIINDEYLSLTSYNENIITELQKFIVNNHFKNIEHIQINPVKTLNSFYQIIKLPYNTLAIFYLEQNCYCNFNKALCSNNTLFIIFSTYTQKPNISIYINVLKCHYKEILHYYSQLVQIIKINNYKLNFNSFCHIYKLIIYEKLNLNIRTFFNKIASLFTNFSFDLIENYIYTIKLSEVIIAKQHNINISGASDIIDVKKDINKMLQNVYLSHKANTLICIIENIEHKYKCSFDNTILHNRVCSFVSKYEYSFIDSNYINNIYLIANLGKIKSDDWALMNRSFLLMKKLKIIHNSCPKQLQKMKTEHSQTVMLLVGLDRLKFIILLLDIYKFKNLEKDDIKLLQLNVKSAIKYILYSH